MHPLDSHFLVFVLGVSSTAALLSSIAGRQLYATRVQARLKQWCAVR